jgi:probable phosphoglycerate mutase
LPLVEEGRARAIGRFLAANGLRPDKVYAAPLKRTTRTAELILEEAGWRLPVVAEARFTEVDYGPDENRTEEEVRRRLGEVFARENGLSVTNDEEVMAYGRRLIDAWDRSGEVPPGWRVDAGAIVRAWRDFADGIADGERVLVCTSNGVIRFAPRLLEGCDDFCREHDIKVATGSLSIFAHEGEGWRCTGWNLKPYAC